jgi:hypothetical protein
MLITFHCKADADISMFAEHAEQLLSIIGKPMAPDGQPRGIIVASEVAHALQRLKSALGSANEQPDDMDQPVRELPVRLSQRAYPLLQMLEAAAKRNCDIVWDS